MKLHRWMLSADDMRSPELPGPVPSTMRAYRCSVCKSGPVWVSSTRSKSGINQAAKQSGIPSDCNEAKVKDVMDR